VVWLENVLVFYLDIKYPASFSLGSKTCLPFYSVFSSVHILSIFRYPLNYAAWGLAYKFGLNQFPLLRELMGERKEPKMTKEEEAAEIEATKKMFYQHPRRRPVSISSLRQTASAGN